MRISNQFLLTMLAFLFSVSVFAKKGDKVKGYVIKNNGDRIEGKVLVGSITDNEVKVVFYEKGKSKKTTYKPTQLKGYGFEDNELDDLGRKVKRWYHFETNKVDYPPKPFGPKTVFMQKEEDGELALYCYYVEVRNDPRKPYRYHYYIKDEGGKIKKISREKFGKDLKGLFKEYPALASRIGKKQFLYRNLDRMVRDYNYWVVNKHDKNEYRVAMKDN
ncbi:MAG: hypothetical protein AAFP19_24780 [Bacteroidota bacterium]